MAERRSRTTQARSNPLQRVCDPGDAGRLTADLLSIESSLPTGAECVNLRGGRKLGTILSWVGDRGGYEVTRVLIGLLLLTAAGLKAWEALFDPASVPLQSGVLASRWAVVAIIEAEMFLGVCLLMNLLRRVTWTATLLLFLLFSVYSARQAFSGEACGCFGAAGMHVPAWATFALDLMAVAALWKSRPAVDIARRGMPDGHRQSRAYGCVHNLRMRLNAIATGASLILVPLVGTAIALHQPATAVIQPGLEIYNAKYAVAEPHQWIGKPFPLLGYVNGGDRLADGEWRLLVYRHDCRTCQEALEVAANMQGRVSSGATEIVLIEVPPYSSTDASVRGMRQLRLEGSMKWMIPTPTWVTLKSGVVRRVIHGALVMKLH